MLGRDPAVVGTVRDAYSATPDRLVIPAAQQAVGRERVGRRAGALADAVSLRIRFPVVSRPSGDVSECTHTFAGRPRQRRFPRAVACLLRLWPALENDGAAPHAIGCALRLTSEGTPYRRARPHQLPILRAVSRLLQTVKS